MKIKSTFCVSAVAALLLAAGCATERVMNTGSTSHAATDPQAVKIFQSEKPVVPYEEIGRVSVDKYNNMAISRSGDEINRLLREKAASIGGDAIIAISEDMGSISGVVIKFK